MPTPEKPSQKPPLTAVGIALVATGLLILVPSGLCVGLLGIGGLSTALSEGSASDAVGLLVELASYGLVPILIGAFFLWTGLRLRKPK